MQTYWETVSEFDKDGFQIVVSITPEDTHPCDLMDCWESEEDKQEFLRKIDDGVYQWFIARFQAFKHGILLGDSYLGGNCYEKISDFLADAYAEDFTEEAIKEAQEKIAKIVEGESCHA